jgi:hypothetical protein
MDAKYKSIASMLLMHPACVSIHVDKGSILAWFVSKSVISAWIKITTAKQEIEFEVQYRDIAQPTDEFDKLSHVVRQYLAA